MEYPMWFDYEVDFFRAESIDEVNKKLIRHGVDAKEVISILMVPKFVWPNNEEEYKIFYRKPVKHPKTETPKEIRGTCVGKGIY
jgi:hypothetical protein